MPAKKDFTQIAFNVAQQAVGAIPKQAPPAKAEAQRKGGLKGGKGRMAALTEEQRHELAVKAAAARWGKKAPAPKGTGARKGR